MAKQLEFDFEDADRRSVLELWRVDEIFEDITEELLKKLYEDERIERKSAGIHAESLATYISMWANTPPNGGLMAIGVEDNGEITGCQQKGEALVEVERRIRNDLVRDAKFDVKRLPVIAVNGSPDYVILFWVHYCDDKVVETNKGEAFIRNTDTKHRLSDQERHELQIDRGQRTFELEPCGLAWPTDFDSAAISAWVAEVRKKKKLKSSIPEEPHHHVLARHHLGKITNGVFIPNNACALLFANDPQTVVPGCMVRFQRIDGIDLKTGEERNVVKNIPIVGTVPRLIVETQSVIDAQLRTYKKLGKDGKFYTAPEYPAEAWQETIVNACVHRSYSLRGANIFVRMFDDHFVVESPGGFPGFVTPENIYEFHYRRNWWLMDAMSYLDFVLCENEGAKRIRRAMIEFGLPEPKFEQKQIDGTIVRVTLRNSGQHLRSKWVDSDVANIIGAERASKLNDFEKRIINFIAEHGRINTTQAMNFLSKPRWGTAYSKLKKMVKNGLIVHVKRGLRDSKGHYVLKVAKPATQN